jgi:hypothetical protein
MTKRTPNQKLQMREKEVAEWRSLYNDLREEVLTIRDDVETYMDNSSEDSGALKMIALDLTRAVEA